MLLKNGDIIMANEEVILNAISQLSSKVDAISSIIGGGSCDRLNNETIAVITATAYSLFGKRVAVRSVKLVK